MSEEDRQYVRWMADHIERELEDALYDWNVNGDDSYFKELDKRYEAGFSTQISLDTIRNGTKR